MRFFDPAGGRIVLEGRDYISFTTPEELRKHIIMVPAVRQHFANHCRQPEDGKRKMPR